MISSCSHYKVCIMWQNTRQTDTLLYLKEGFPSFDFFVFSFFLWLLSLICGTGLTARHISCLDWDGVLSNLDWELEGVTEDCGGDAIWWVAVGSPISRAALQVKSNFLYFYKKEIPGIRKRRIQNSIFLRKRWWQSDTVRAAVLEMKDLFWEFNWYLSLKDNFNGLS